MSSSFPALRLRRNRRTPWSRSMVRENLVTPADMIWPIFITDAGDEVPVPSMPGVTRYSVDRAVTAAKEARDAGIPCLALFPHTPSAARSEYAEEALNRDNLMNRALSAIKSAVPEIGLLADVALDPYTSHGQDGLVDGESYVLNDETVGMLVQQAVLQAQCGADIVAPSDMMDGRVGAIRTELDKAGLPHTQIMAYSAKYASAYYGPFRDAVGSSGVLKGDKKTYQMDPANRLEAIREVEQDILEGADSVMVKPGLPYLDVIRDVKDAFGVPTFAYQVSGEYAQIMAAAGQGWLEEKDVALESLMSFKRAGADGVLTYFALKAARWLAE